MSADVIHSLGTAHPAGARAAGLLVAAAVAAGLLAVLLAGAEVRQRVAGRRRLTAVLGAPPPKAAPDGPAPARHARLRCWGAAAGAGLGVTALVGAGPVGVLAGLGAAAGAVKLLRHRQSGSRTPGGIPPPDPSQLPLCADLMAACLAAGATPEQATGAVGGCLDGPLGQALLRVRAELRLGADPAECWDRFGKLPGCREMGRCLGRASTTGTAPVAEMSRLAADYRAAQGRSAMARARKAAVLATAPLGMCFLPAFLLVGVAPVVLGLARTVLGGAMN